jgi:hypothetical protein
MACASCAVSSPFESSAIANLSSSFGRRKKLEAAPRIATFNFSASGVHVRCGEEVTSCLAGRGVNRTRGSHWNFGHGAEAGVESKYEAAR